jgi:hypothetical protein
MICTLIIHPSTAPDDENRLQDEDPVLSGRQFTVILTEGTTKFYDFEARDCGTDAVVADDDGLEVFENFVWTIN